MQQKHSGAETVLSFHSGDESQSRPLLIFHFMIGKTIDEQDFTLLNYYVFVELKRKTMDDGRQTTQFYL